MSEGTTKLNLMKTKIESLEKENSLLEERLKKEKDVVKGLRDENKSSKEEIGVSQEKLSKELKELTSLV